MSLDTGSFLKWEEFLCSFQKECILSGYIEDRFEDDKHPLGQHTGSVVWAGFAQWPENFASCVIIASCVIVVNLSTQSSNPENCSFSLFHLQEFLLAVHTGLCATFLRFYLKTDKRFTQPCKWLPVNPNKKSISFHFERSVQFTTWEIQKGFPEDFELYRCDFNLSIFNRDPPAYRCFASTQKENLFCDALLPTKLTL